MKRIHCVDTVLISSGDGTRAFAIMDAYHKGFLPSVSISALISTEDNNISLSEAAICGVKTIIIDRKKSASEQDFNHKLQLAIKAVSCDLIFVTDYMVSVYPIDGIPMYSIHPAELAEFSGDGMSGIRVHEKVLEKVLNSIARGKNKRDDEFFTYPTVYEVTPKYSSEKPFMTVAVQITPYLIGMELSSAAELLQRHVAGYEHRMLPAAVNMAAYKILFS